ncbi:MAG TPA: allantoate amidohydrolase [Pseudonocardiaceae bacterium]|nr:allantoate amidohydrolase [Pseudonocardiaceae bacterium]
MSAEAYRTLWREQSEVGRDHRRGGYSRHGFDDFDLALREWFVAEAAGRGLTVEADRNGNLWAWLGEPGRNAVVTGSHLDSVPGGGAFDGPLGVVSALLALDTLRARGFQPRRPLAVVVFAEEEGGRFGVPCLGSRLLTGAVGPDAARRLTDTHGVSLGAALQRTGIDPEGIGSDPDVLGRIGVFVELHVEQGRAMVDLDAPVAVATTILAHGRWRLSFHGEGNHAGSTALDDRRDPMLPAAHTVAAARRVAGKVTGARATVGRLEANPGGTNVIASSVDVWLDARAPTAADTRAVVDELIGHAEHVAQAEGCRLVVREDSFGDRVVFDPALRNRLAALLGGVPALPTGAGHDAGILAAHVPSAMLFVRNPTGVSHAPGEHAEEADCVAGVAALATVLEHLAS